MFLIFCGTQLLCSIVERKKNNNKKKDSSESILMDMRGKKRCFVITSSEESLFCVQSRQKTQSSPVINDPSRIHLLLLALQLPLFPPCNTPIRHHLLFSLLYLSQHVVLKTFHFAVCHKHSDLYMPTERDCPKMAVAQKPPGSVLKYRHSAECWRGTCCSQTPTEVADASASKRMLESQLELRGSVQFLLVFHRFFFFKSLTCMCQNEALSSL